MESTSATKHPGGKGPRAWARTFFREIGIPLLLALVVIQFVIQAFKIPSGSMERSLLVGDYLLGLKFVYGSPLPYSEKRLPALRDPQKGDIIIFHYPMDPDAPNRDPKRFRFLAHTLLFGDYYWDTQADPGQSHLLRYESRDFIKRCVAVSGDTLLANQDKLYINGKPSELPPNGQYVEHPAGAVWPHVLPRDSLGPLRIPAPGDSLKLDSMPMDEFLRVYSLAIQEHPNKAVRCSLWIEENGHAVPDAVISQVDVDPYPEFRFFMERIWSRATQLPGGVVLADLPVATLSQAVSQFFFTLENTSGRFRNVMHLPALPQVGWSIQRSLDLWNTADSSRGLPHRVLRKRISIEGQWDSVYRVQDRVLFMMGDNRDRSSDARFWGYLARRNVKARALIIYFSLENEDDAVVLTNPLTWWRLPERIRWTRVGRLVHD